MVKKIWLPLATALMMGSLSLAAPEKSAEIVGSPEEIGQSTAYEYSYSSSLFSADSYGDSSSTMYMDDGFGRLTTFEMIKTGNKATLTIRQNGAIRWEGSFKTDSALFGVTRQNDMGKIRFKITIGNHTLYATVNTDDVWIVTDHGDKIKEPLPRKEAAPSLETT